MTTLRSAQPSSELRPYVRAYAQRVVGASEPNLVEAVPAQLEQILNFELGTMPGIFHRDGRLTDVALVGGAQTAFSGSLELRPGVESFAIFFQPAGWSQLFKVPICEITNQFYDATAVMGPSIRGLWNCLGEHPSFEQRVIVAEAFLRRCLQRAVEQDRIARAVINLFRLHGTLPIPRLAFLEGMGLRQFERQFQLETGASPKSFARVSRFQAALDAKLASPERTWLDISHSFGYHDQMHMIHDFERLGRTTPTHLIAQMGDVRPPALALGSEGWSD
jgi:AraC-like DNA-binding protein